MKNIIKFIVFIIITISIFFIENFNLIGAIFLCDCIIAVRLKINFKKIIYSLKILMPIVIFTILINIISSGIYDATLIGIRMVVCFLMTYIYSKTVTTLEISETIQKLFYPLKLFKVNTKNIGIMVSIAICMIPILKEEIESLIKSMKSRGKQIKITNITIVIKPLLISILNKTIHMEKSLISRVYSEEA